jgi:NAD(P)-dependent dehydrogenase (short-subunit alcohol dehydrogenase family)
MTRRVAIVTGASAGVGRATTRVLASHGWDVGLIARGEDGLKTAVDEARGLGVRAVALPADVADPDALQRAADDAARELGGIDAWVNNAMAGLFGAFTDVPLQDFRRVTEVTYLGYAYGTRVALDHMVPRDRGVIVQVGSALSERGIPLQSAYCGAKHAIQGFTESVRAELLHEHSRVRLCEVHLPAVNTPQFRWVKSFMHNEAQPVPPIYQPEAVADIIVSVVEHPRRETWVGGSTVATLAANRLASGLLDRYLGRTGYRSQQTGTPLDVDRPTNLYEPVPGDHGARGAFDAEARSDGPELWALRHRRAVIGALTLAAVGSAVFGPARTVRRRGD